MKQRFDEMKFGEVEFAERQSKLKMNPRFDEMKESAKVFRGRAQKSEKSER
jgi:hypothetical protein